MAPKDKDIPGQVGTFAEGASGPGPGEALGGIEHPPDATPLADLGTADVKQCDRCHQLLAVGGLCPDRKCRGGVTP